MTAITIKRNALAAGLLTGSLALFTCTFAHAEGLNPLAGAIGEMKPIVDMRLRYEFVEQAPLARDADAFTWRTRLGFETGKAWDTALLAEVEWVAALSQDYNNTFNGKTTYPVVADPKSIEVNRLQLTNTSFPGTVITLGRQRINMDDQRFVGNVGWRQNEQTYDALRVVNKSIKNLTVDVAYFRQVNRVFGDFSAQGEYSGDNFFFNGAYQFPLGKLTAYAYLFEIDEAIGIRDSSQTYGFRFSGTKPVSKIKVTYTAAYSYQTDYAKNPLSYSADNYLLELSGAFRQFNVGAGYEVLTGNGVKGFTTPFATLHKFQGWADKFLATPPNGIKDMYITAGYTTKGVGPFDTVGLSGAYHKFDSDRLSLHYGDEINVQLMAKWQRFTFTIKYADYDADRFATDTKKLWAQVDFSL